MVKTRDIKIQLNDKFNTNGTVHDTLESAFAYWDRKLPDSNVTFLIFPKAGVSEEIEAGMEIACCSIDYAKKCLGLE